MWCSWRKRIGSKLLGLLNLTLETKNHKTILEHDDFLDILFRSLSGRLIKKYDKGEKQSKSYVNTSECMGMSKRYACLTFGCLVECKTVSNLLTNSIAQQEVMLDDEFQILISISHMEDQECQYNVALSCNKILSCSSNHEDVITNGCICVIFRLIKWDDISF